MLRRLSIVALVVASFSLAACSDATAPENGCPVTVGSDTRC